MTRASRSSDVVAEALERAAWAEADAFLARAWRETAVLERDLVKALAAVERSQEAGKRPNAAQKRMSACLDRAALALQDLEQVAALRRLRMGACGEAAYDPALHTVVDGFDVAPGDPVLVQIIADWLTLESADRNGLAVNRDFRFGADCALEAGAAGELVDPDPG
jgi:hypothetical protein